MLWLSRSSTNGRSVNIVTCSSVRLAEHKEQSLLRKPNSRSISECRHRSLNVHHDTELDSSTAVGDSQQMMRCIVLVLWKQKLKRHEAAPLAVFTLLNRANAQSHIYKREYNGNSFGDCSLEGSRYMMTFW